MCECVCVLCVCVCMCECVCVLCVCVCVCVCVYCLCVCESVCVLCVCIVCVCVCVCMCVSIFLYLPFLPYFSMQLSVRLVVVRLVDIVTRPLSACKYYMLNSLVFGAIQQVLFFCFVPGVKMGGLVTCVINAYQRVAVVSTQTSFVYVLTKCTLVLF